MTVLFLLMWMFLYSMHFLREVLLLTICFLFSQKSKICFNLRYAPLYKDEGGVVLKLSVFYLVLILIFISVLSFDAGSETSQPQEILEGSEDYEDYGCFK